MMTFDDSLGDPRRAWAAAAHVGRGGASFRLFPPSLQAV